MTSTDVMNYVRSAGAACATISAGLMQFYPNTVWATKYAAAAGLIAFVCADLTKTVSTHVNPDVPPVPPAAK